MCTDHKPAALLILIMRPEKRINLTFAAPALFRNILYRRLKTLDFHGLQPPFLALYDTERYHGSTQCDDVGFIYQKCHDKSRNHTKFERQCWYEQKRIFRAYRISVRTLEDWEAGRRRPPEYIPRMIYYQLKYEELLQELRKRDYANEQQRNELIENCGGNFDRKRKNAGRSALRLRG